MIDLRQNINDGRDVRRIIGARRRDRPAEKSYPKDFKPIGIPKYDGKQDPR
jgi:hypothetical protein